MGLGCELPYARPHPSNQDVDGLILGVKKRGATQPPDPDPHMKEQLRFFFKEVFAKEFEVMEAPKYDWLTPESVREWLDDTHYPDHRREGLFQEFLELQDYFARRNTVIEGFMKDESYDEFKYPRLINPRSDAFKVVVGPVFKHIEHSIYKHPSFLKGVPRDEWPDYVLTQLTPGKRTVSNDYTAYEAHAVAWIQELEFIIYEHVLGMYVPKFWKWMKDTFLGNQHMIYKYITVTQETFRASGDQQTSAGNGIVNLGISKFFAWYWLGTVGIVVDGDDSLSQYEGCREPTKADFAKVGMTAKPEYHRDLTTASFCGLIFDDQDKIIIADIVKVMLKFGWSTSNYRQAKPSTLKGLAKVKAYSFLYQYAGCPIVSKMCLWVLRHTAHIDIRRLLRSPSLDMQQREFVQKGIERESKLVQLARRTPSIRTRLIVEELYGIDVATQRAMERWFDTSQTYEPMPAKYMHDLVNEDCKAYTLRYVSICHVKDSSEDFPD